MASANGELEVAKDILSVVLLAAVVLLGFFLFWVALAAGVLVLIYIIFRMYQNSDAVQERKAREHIQQLYRDAQAVTPKAATLEEFSSDFVRRVSLDRFPESVSNDFIMCALNIYNAEAFSSALVVPPTICNSMEGARYKDYLSDYTAKIRDPQIAEEARDAIIFAVNNLLDRVSFSVDDPENDGLATVPVTHYVDDPGKAVMEVIAPFYNDDTAKLALFTSMREQFDRNGCEASGLPYTRENANSPKFVLPPDYEGEDVAYAYLKDTPLLSLFRAELPFTLPDDVRFEHTWCIAPQGTGKTQLIQNLLTRDFERVANEEASVFVMDSQRDLINQIRTISAFSPGGDLDGKLIVIEPDLSFPLAINPFDITRDRHRSYSEDEREELSTEALNNLTYVFSSLLGEGGTMTAKQTTLYRYVIHLLMKIPQATLYTFSDILQNGLDQYEQYVDQLDEPARLFFRDQFTKNKDFRTTRDGLAWRLSLLMENKNFARMFSSPQNKLDLFTELNSSKVILVNADKKKLGGEERTAIFGRFFITLLLSAAQERAILPRRSRLPVFAYIDEAHDYIQDDPQITVILDQARKMRVGMFLANQRGKQIKNPNVLDALLTTSIKFAHTDNVDDARALSHRMKTTPEFIANQPERHFAVFARNHTPKAVSLRIPFFVMEKMDHITEDEYKPIREDMRRRYSTPYQKPVRGAGFTAVDGDGEDRSDVEYPQGESDYKEAAEDQRPYEHDDDEVKPSEDW